MIPAAGNNAGAIHESGVSEAIGAVLMISIVVMAIALISVMLVSQTTPQKVPNVQFMTGTNQDGTVLYLYHNGGDTLEKGQFAVVTDVDPAPRTNYDISGGGTNWSLGRNLILTGYSAAKSPQSVAIIYTAGGSANTGVVLRSGSANFSVLRQSIRPEATPVIPHEPVSGPGYIYNDVVNLTNSSYFIEAIKENVTSGRINLYKNSLSPSGGLKIGTQLSFKVTDTTGRSSMIYDTQYIQLNKSDIVTVTIRSNTQNFKIFGIAPQVWDMSVDSADLSILRSGGIPSISVSGAAVYHTWIDAYEFNAAGSNLEIDATGDSPTALMVNRTQILPVAYHDSHPITVYNPKPLPVGLFVIMVDNSAKSVYFVGSADKICIGAACSGFGV